MDKCPVIHRGVLAGSYPSRAALWGSNKCCHKNINAQLGSGSKSMQNVRNCKEKDTEQQQKNLIIMVLCETLPSLFKCCTCFFGLSAFSIKAWQRVCLINTAKSKLESQYQTNKTHCTKGKQQSALQASPPPSEKPKGKKNQHKRR